ncbi:uncharacterized protein E0L32_010510 [Thyridium curvatum]|uniref:Plasma membrane fusion protein PRM1 n=1 Tax=Thyridium curvatum TaxID=1093900 RepID=A0A507AK94_9PEZI|nr:uncharacterized protein E0L32_010510 [Thyridium curvatum]TPX07823.1 hypothetical protein E0L32_010510 [Thyridium curvatum]
MFPSKEKSAHDYPDVPASLNHDSFELQDAKRNQLAPPPPDTAGGITPYLGLRARLSQIWINRWTVLLILVLVRVLILLAGLNDDIGDAKIKALSACTKVEDIGSAMASMPHYLSVGVNSLAAEGITTAVNAMVTVLMMILTAVEQLIMFVIQMYIGTYVCLTGAVIHGTFDIGIGAADAATKAMNAVITDVTNGLNDDVKKVQDVINDTFGKIANSVSGLFGGKLDPPKLDISGRVNDLRNIKIDDTDFVKTLKTLNSTIPTYDEAKKATEDAIAIPFNMLKTLVNGTYGGYAFDKKVFPVAQKEALSFCSSNSKLNDFFESLYKLAAKAKIAFIVVILVLAILACVVMAWWEIKRYRRQQRHAKVFTEHGYDPMDVVYIAGRPVTATAGIKIASRFKGKRQLLVRWAVAYGTSLPAIFVLSLAIAGFFSCLCQFILLRSIQKEAPVLANQVGDFAGSVVTTLEDASMKWAVDANGVITKFNTEVNDDLFGWVTNATTAVNNTLNTFTTEINDGITKVFGGTVLENTVRGVVRCLIGLKVEAVEKGLTWVHDHAHVSFPLFPNDTFSMGAKESVSGDSQLTSFLSSPSSVTTDEITGAVDRVINHMHANLVKEALISTGLLLVYVIVVLIGVVRSAVGMMTPDRTRGEGGQRYYLTGDGRPPMSPRGAAAADNDSNNARFPQFGESSGSSDLVAGASSSSSAAAARARSDEKFAQEYWSKNSVPGGKGLKSPGHWRKSSYGHVEDAGR